MSNEPRPIKPDADDHHDRKPLILINRQVKPRRKPVRRAWKVSQYVPLVRHGLAGNGTLAVDMLNLSNLPVTCSAEKCLAWARAFCRGLEGGVQVGAALEAADGKVKSRG